MSNEFDFVVVGAGPAGCPIAARLAESKAAPKVLLLESGIAKDTAATDLAADRFIAHATLPNSTVIYETTPQEHCNGRVLPYHRGKILGGSTAINLSTYTVGPKDDYDRWAEEVGDSSFSWDNSVRIRKKIESYGNDLSEDQRKDTEPDMSVHGSSGPLAVSFPKVFESEIAVHMEAARNGKLGFTKDINDGKGLGLAVAPGTLNKGKRVTAASAYLSDAPSNLTILTSHQVTRVVFEGDRAVGVVANGKEYRASKEVILSAGAVDTPKLLMLSGIGDRDELKQVGIDARHHLPGVGKNLQDHYFTAMAWELKSDLMGWVEFYTSPEKIEQAKQQFAKDGTGPLALFLGAFSVGFFKGDAVLDTPEFASLPADVQAHIKRPTVPIWEISSVSPPATRGMDYSKPYLTMASFLHVPQSVGSIRLASSDPSKPPIIDPNFFSHPFDHVVALTATRAMLGFVKDSPTLQDNILAPADVPASESDEDILAYWRAGGLSTWHPSCTVKMGKTGDATACVDSSFRVMGLKNLRVADLSVTPFLPNCHPQSVVYLIGELAAEKLIEEYYLA